MKQEYRSAVRSRNLIRTAYLELLEEKGAEKITVTDIVKRADINRSTFYAHYPDVEGLREAIENEIVERTFSIIPQESYTEILKDPVTFLMSLNQLVEGNMDLYRILSKTENSEKIERKMKDLFVQKIRSSAEVAENFSENPIIQIRVNFFISGMLDVYQKWIRGELNCSLEEVAKDLGRIIWLSAQDILKKFT